MYSHLTFKVFREFLQQNVDCLTIEENIYMRLCSEDKILHEQAIHMMKEKYEVNMNLHLQLIRFNYIIV